MIKIPGYELAYMLIDNCSIVRREKVSIAMTIFLEEWNKTYPHRPSGDVRKSIGELMAGFDSQTKRVNAYAEDGTYVSNARVNGLTISPTVIWVKMEEGDLLCETSFIHELMHVSIWAIKKTDGDPDHLGHLYSGWDAKKSMIIQEANKRLCELGI